MSVPVTGLPAECAEDEIEVPIVHVERPVRWFTGPIAILPPVAPFISPALLALDEDDENSGTRRRP